MPTKQPVDQSSKDLKEVTLYNFATIRNADYLNHEALKKNIGFITYNYDEHEENSTKSDSYFSATKACWDFLNFATISQKDETERIEKHSSTSLKIIKDDEATQIRINNFYDQIINLYKSRTDNFHKINNLLKGLDFENEIKIELKDEKAFIKKVWLCLVYNIKIRNNFKEKEIATNLLRYFHLKNYQYLIDDEKLEERWDNLSKLMNAQIIIPEELFPKHETFFYGKKDILQSKYTPSEYFKETHFLKVLKLRKEVFYQEDEDTISGIDASIKDKEETIGLYNRKKKTSTKLSTNIGNFTRLPYIATIEFIDSKCYFLVSIDLSKIDRKDFSIEDAYLKIKGRKFYFSKEPENIKISDAGFDIYFELKNKDGSNLFKIPNEEIAENVNFDFEVDFASGEFKSLKSQLVWKYKSNRYQCNSCLALDDGIDLYGKAFEPSGYGIQMLGIAEYRKVVSTVSRYVPAEVARIENLMSGEFREKVTTQETSTEITEFESTETDKETTNETSTNDRFQMQNEVAQILNDQRNNTLNASAGYSGGGYFANITSGNASTNSKTQSNNLSITQAKEITNKAVEKIVSKVKKERTTKITEKFIDVNKYGFDNRGNKEHVSGVYRHINAVYRNRIQNYGKRLTYEFSIPEPALLHKKGTEIIGDENLTEEIKKIPTPTNPFDFIQTPSDLNEQNFEAFKKMFDNKNFTEFPKHIHSELIEGHSARQVSVQIPDGFVPVSFNFNSIGFPYGVQMGYDSGHPVSFLIVYENLIIFSSLVRRKNGNNYHDDINIEGKIKYTIDQKNIEFGLTSTSNNGRYIDGFKFNSTINFIPSQKKIEEWQKEQFDLLVVAYEARKKVYDEKIKDIIDAYKKKKTEDKKAQIEAAKKDPKSPSRNRQIEIITLKRNCLSYLIDETDEDNEIRKFGTDLIKETKDFEKIRIDLSPKLDEYTAFVRFLEQAFEWENMSYSFYPYFWGRESTWFESYNQYNEDPLHKAFLQAGMARVIVTVRPGFEDAVNLYMTTGKIWLGGNLPVYGSSMFVSIADELKTGNEEFFIDGEWESVLPTNLIAIQSSGVSIEQKGLPNLDEYDGLGTVEDRKALPKKKKFLGLF